MRTLCSVLLALYLVQAPAHSASPVALTLPKYRLSPDELAVIVNDADPLSVQIGDYYRKARGLPAGNLIHVRFEPGRTDMPAQTFSELRQRILADTPANVQAYAVTWAAPYRVACMSFTSALTFGFDRSWCSRQQCDATRRSPLYRYSGARPWTDLGVRPSMALAATSFADARALIDRGVAADGSQPSGRAYLVSTTDKARNVRARFYPWVKSALQPRIATQILATDALRDRDDVMFYFTGRTRVEGLDSLAFLPGAVADHLTSTGGRLTDSDQMSALRWLQAGATGSYGTVVEPCNLTGKFPNPGLLMETYTRGRTLIQAYWASVQQPGEGLFIGEPLSAPYAGFQVEIDGRQLRVHTRALLPGRYDVEYAKDPVGPWHRLGRLAVDRDQTSFVLPRPGDGYFRLTAQNAAQ